MNCLQPLATRWSGIWLRVSLRITPLEEKVLGVPRKLWSFALLVFCKSYILDAMSPSK